MGCEGGGQDQGKGEAEGTSEGSRVRCSTVPGLALLPLALRAEGLGSEGQGVSGLGLGARGSEGCGQGGCIKKRLVLGLELGSVHQEGPLTLR